MLTGLVRLSNLSGWLQKVVVGGLVLLFFSFVSYLNVVKFDYGATVCARLARLSSSPLLPGLNMKVCVGLALLGGVLWMTWAAKHWARPYAKKVVLFYVLLYLAGAFEVLDFPPIGGILDAHALWHGCTIPLTVLWYHMLCQDAQWEMKLLHAE